MHSFLVCLLFILFGSGCAQKLAAGRKIYSDGFDDMHHHLRRLGTHIFIFVSLENIFKCFMWKFYGFQSTLVPAPWCVGRFRGVLASCYAIGLVLLVFQVRGDAI